MDHSKHLCHGKVTDDEFLEHMIPHHQMAIDMSRQVLKTTKNPAIISMARDIIWNQQNEIWLMKSLLRSPSYNSELSSMNSEYKQPILSHYLPCKSEDYSTKGKCDMKFMKPCKKEKIINNYDKKIQEKDFWSGLNI